MININLAFVFIGTALFFLWGAAIIVHNLSMKIDDKLETWRQDTLSLLKILHGRLDDIETQQIISKAYHSIGAYATPQEFEEHRKKGIDPYICQYCHKPIIVGMRECDHCGAPLYNGNDISASYYKAGGVRMRGYLVADDIKKYYDVWAAK